jgi:hypothetical protein
MPRLDLPTSTESAVFAAICQVLREDPVLQKAVKTWETFEGAQKTVQPPPSAAMPWVRLVPVPPAMRMAEAAAYQLDFAVHAWIATRGLDVVDQLNLWAAFRVALNYSNAFRNTTVFAYLRELGSSLHQVGRPRLGVLPQPGDGGEQGVQDLISEAEVTMVLRLNFQ